MKGSIRRTFGPRSNAEVMLATGGEALAAHASFDPDYGRASAWIRHHAVGPAVLSPVLIAGLTGALTEAAFPHAVPVSQSYQQFRPLIVGVTVRATIEVANVVETMTMQQQQQQQGEEEGNGDRSVQMSEKRNKGYEVSLKTQVTRVRDDALIAEGTQEIWIPDYLRM
jgi:hypothetical protein